MRLIHQKCDLFTMPDKYALAHCISDDIAMGAGIAVKFTRMGVKNIILQSGHAIPANNAFLPADGGYCIPVTLPNNGRTVLNIVTKSRYWHKPTIQTMRSALQDTAKLASSMGIRFIAMPLIGCGLDRLHWPDVEREIRTAFQNTDIEIVVCSL